MLLCNSYFSTPPNSSCLSSLLGQGSFPRRKADLPTRVCRPQPDRKEVQGRQGAATHLGWAPVHSRAPLQDGPCDLPLGPLPLCSPLHHGTPRSASWPQPMGCMHGREELGEKSPGFSALPGAGRCLQHRLWLPLGSHPALLARWPAQPCPDSTSAARPRHPRPDGATSPARFCSRPRLFRSDGEAEEPVRGGREAGIRDTRKPRPPPAGSAQKPECKADLGWFLFP